MATTGSTAAAIGTATGGGDAGAEAPATNGCAAGSIRCGGVLSHSGLYGLEHRMARFVNSIRIAADTVGVRQVAGDGIQAHGLGAEARTYDVEYFEG